MLTFVGFVVVAFIILYKRSTEIIVVNPLRGQNRSPLPGAAEPDQDDDDAPESVPDFARLLNTIQQAAQKPVSDQGRAAILRMVQNDKFIEAIQLYRRL